MTKTRMVLLGALVTMGLSTVGCRHIADRLAHRHDVHVARHAVHKRHARSAAKATARGVVIGATATAVHRSHRRHRVVHHRRVHRYDHYSTCD